MNLRSYLYGLPRGGASDLAVRLGISKVYLLQLAARQDGREPAPDLCVRIEKETGGEVSRLDLRDDADQIWPEEAARRAGKRVRYVTKQQLQRPSDTEDVDDIDLEPGGK